jgi:RNA polymerase sigma factor (sigma-70 family)
MHDADLLSAYSESGSEEAFAKIVHRFLPLVYGAALRRVGGDVHRAQDVTQMVFVALAREAPRLVRHPDLTGWLFTTTRFIAANLVRSERRRQLREHAAFVGAAIAEPPATPPEHLQYLLDDALAELPSLDRQILLLRFFRDFRHSQIAVQINSSENAVQKRIDRALDRLKGLLSRRGITSTVVALAFALEQQASVAVPAGLAAASTVAGMTVSGGTSGLAVTPGLIGATKQPIIALAALAVASSAGLAWYFLKNPRLREVPVAATGLQPLAPVRRIPDPPASPMAVAEDNFRPAPADAASLPTRSDFSPPTGLTPAPRQTPPIRPVRANDERLVPLVIDYPKPLFAGTPRPRSIPNLDPKVGGSEDLWVPPGTVLLSRGKRVTSSDSLPVIGTLSSVTDGEKSGRDETYVELGPGLQWIQIDLGASARVAVVAVWHFHAQARVYHDVIVQVSDDATFRDGVATVFNNDHDNSSRLGQGPDFAYVETYCGRLITGHGVTGRYVRLYSHGNSSDELNHYCEVEVFGEHPP